MAKINLLRKSTKWIPDLSSYKLLLEVTSTEDIVKEVFIKQRTMNYVRGSFDDTFVAVATPTQLEDFDVNSPAAGSSYFRDSTVEIVARTSEVIEHIFNSIVWELQKLVKDVEVLNDFNYDGIYEIEADNIDINMAALHLHYRLPLTAAPAGLNGITGEIHVVDDEDEGLPGWLNTDVNDPSGYKFKYNVAQDSALSNLFPPNSDKIAYAHVEVNGVTDPTNVLINTNGIFWKNNLVGRAPWPEDYVNPEDTGATVNSVTLIFDFIA